MTLKICDLAWGKPAPSLLAAAGINAACLYVSQDTTGKNMNAPYVGSLAGAGLWTVTNFEYGASQMLGGYTQGVTDARLGLSQAHACGMPAGRPIYYSADFDATAAQMTAAVIPYLQGARSVTGPGTVGFYGGYPQVLAVLAFWAQHYPGERVYIWQTPAWSGGQWSPAADIRQQVAQETIGGAPVDIDYAYSSDFGQWKPGIVPATPPTAHPQEDTMLILRVQGSDSVYGLDGGTLWGIADPPSLQSYIDAQVPQVTVSTSEISRIQAAQPAAAVVTVDASQLTTALVTALSDAGLLGKVGAAIAHGEAVQEHNDTPPA